jgi:hypothetical protein
MGPDSEAVQYIGGLALYIVHRPLQHGAVGQEELTVSVGPRISRSVQWLIIAWTPRVRFPAA